MTTSPNDRYNYRKKRVREKIFGTSQKPRLSVYRSLHHIYAQIIDDTTGHTLISASSLDPTISGSTGNCESARSVGKLIAQKAKSSGIQQVVFDRGGNLYHGRIRALGDAIREGGLSV